jgi:hypothetical protein
LKGVEPGGKYPARPGGSPGAGQASVRPAAKHDTTGGDAENDADGQTFIDPMGPNAACYVCHMTFVFEELSVVHKAQKVTCIKCHGLSAGHANDENIGATPPDIRYPRDKIDAACGECHEGHDVPAVEVLVRFIERKLPAKPAAVCTDCHGRHRIPAAASEAGEQ